MKKLSEMNTSELMDTLCRIAEPVGKIFADPAVGDAFARVYKATQEKSSPLHFYALCASELMPVLMGEEHRGNVLKVLACIKGVTPEALEKQNGMDTMRDVVALLMTDTEALTFFRAGESKRRKKRAGGAVPARVPADDGGAVGPA